MTLVAAGLLAPVVRAAPPEEESKAAARALAAHGYALYEAGKFREALDALVQADRLYHAPTLVFAAARAHIGLGELVEARALCQRVADESLPPSAPQPFRDAQRLAIEELANLDKRIPTIEIVVRGGAGGALRVTLDGADAAAWAPGQPLRVNPGSHRIAVVTAAQVSVTRTVELPEGTHLRVPIDLPLEAPQTPATSIASLPAEAPAQTSRPWLGPAIGGFILGAGGLGLGIGAGVSALGSNSAIRQDCGGTTCPPSEQDKLSSAKTMATASTVGFVLAGAGLVTGVVLVAVQPGSAKPAKVAIAVGPAALRLKGEF